MQTSHDLRTALRQCAARSSRAQGFDATVREHVGGLPLDWETLAPVVEDLLRAVQEELEAAERCKERKHFHRAWVRGFVAGCAKGGLRGDEALVPLAHLTLLTSYDEGIMLRVFASSLGFGVGQAWAEISGVEAERREWLAALRTGIREGLKVLAELPEADPELMAPEAKLVAAVERGMATGAFMGRWTPRRRAPKS